MQSLAKIDTIFLSNDSLVFCLKVIMTPSVRSFCCVLTVFAVKNLLFTCLLNQL